MAAVAEPLCPRRARAAAYDFCLARFEIVCGNLKTRALRNREGYQIGVCPIPVGFGTIFAKARIDDLHFSARCGHCVNLREPAHIACENQFRAVGRKACRTFGCGRARDPAQALAARVTDPDFGVARRSQNDRHFRAVGRHCTAAITALVFCQGRTGVCVEVDSEQVHKPRAVVARVGDARTVGREVRPERIGLVAGDDAYVSKNHIRHRYFGSSARDFRVCEGEFSREVAAFAQGLFDAKIARLHKRVDGVCTR